MSKTIFDLLTVSHLDLLKMQIYQAEYHHCVISACISESVFVPSKGAIINYILYSFVLFRTTMVTSTAGAAKKANTANPVNSHLNLVE